MIRHIYRGYSAAYSRHTGHKQPIRKQQRDKAALLYTGASPHLRERVQRAGEQSVTFGGKDEQRRNRATLFVKKGGCCKCKLIAGNSLFPYAKYAYLSEEFCLRQ